MSEQAIGFDGLLHYYNAGPMAYGDTIAALVNHTAWATEKPLPYMVACDSELSQSVRVQSYTIWLHFNKYGLLRTTGKGA